MSKTIEEAESEVVLLYKQLLESESKRKVYENGGAKLYYSQQRKMSEMANVLNKYNLEDMDMVSKSDATFERIFKLLEKSESISVASAGLGVSAGVTGDERKDTEKIPFIETVATKRD